MKKICIDNKSVGANERPFIIAEAGSNHNKNLELSKKLIDAASEAGADAVKFQTFEAEKLVVDSNIKEKVVERSIHDIIRKLELPRQWHLELSGYAKSKGIIFLSTPFDEEAVDLLDDLGVPAFKIASGDITNLPLLKYTAKKQKPMIIATGGSTIGEIEEAVDTVEKAGNNQIILLHCVASYPTPVEEANLNSMITLKKAFNYPVGFSDHTLGIIAPVVAATMGAVMIEKHFTLDRKMQGPDHFYAIEPSELSAMVESVLAVAKLRGKPAKEVSSVELECRKLGRRSIYAKNDISAGAVITKDMLSLLRPAVGLDPKYLDIIVGRKATADIRQNEPISWQKI
jgi:pseudaminic acid synthase